MKISNKRRLANARELLAYFVDKHAKAKAKEDKLDREIAVDTAKNSEWYTLNSCLTIDSMRPLYDQMTIAVRLDEIMAEMRKSYDKSTAKAL